MQSLNNGVFEISRNIAEKLLESKDKIHLLSFPARRVLYSGRATGKWFTKSENTYNEILYLYGIVEGINGRKMGKKVATKKVVSTQASATPEPPEPKEVIQKLDQLLKILASYQGK